MAKKKMAESIHNYSIIEIKITESMSIDNSYRKSYADTLNGAPSMSDFLRPLFMHIR